MNAPSPIACDLTAIPAAERDQHITTAQSLIRQAQETLHLSNGFALRFANEKDMFMRLARFVDHERLCCPFFGFSLILEPDHGPIWLHLTGRDGVKEFLQSELVPQPAI